MGIAKSLQEASQELHNRGYRPDTLYVGLEVYSSILKEDSFNRTVSTAPDKIGQFFGYDVVPADGWQEMDAAVLVDTQGSKDAALISKKHLAFYAPAAVKFYP